MRGWTKGRSDQERGHSTAFQASVFREKGAHSQQCEAFGEGRDFNTAFKSSVISLGCTSTLRTGYIPCSGTTHFSSFDTPIFN